MKTNCHISSGFGFTKTRLWWWSKFFHLNGFYYRAYATSLTKAFGRIHVAFVSSFFKDFYFNRHHKSVIWTTLITIAFGKWRRSYLCSRDGIFIRIHGRFLFLEHKCDLISKFLMYARVSTWMNQRVEEVYWCILRAKFDIVEWGV